MIGDKIKIVALNCQGLGDEKKRRDIMLNLRNKKIFYYLSYRYSLHKKPGAQNPK